MDRTEQSRKAGKILVVDDDVYLLSAIRQTLTMHDYRVDTFDKPTEALPAIMDNEYLAVIADVKMPKINGLELLKLIRETDQELPVIMMTGHGDVTMAVSAMKNGAYDFLEKPVDENIMLSALARAVEKRRLVLENRRLSRELQLARERRKTFHGFVGQHKLMQRLYDTIELVAGEDDTVLICGETGTGKELAARAIHKLSGRRDQPFVAVNMGAIPGEMLESELFGYNRGAFTGATTNKMGKFEYAGAGTIFLDEICSLPFNLQAKLLRTIEEKTVTRLGCNTSIPVRARIITASNRNLQEEIKRGAFRQDLYFRLNVIPVYIPSLRERKSDIPLLAEHFRDEYCRERQLEVKPFVEQVTAAMLAQDWPGNVRELMHHVKRLCIYGAGSDSAAPGDKGSSDREDPEAAEACLKNFLEDAERQHLVGMLARHRGQIVKVHKLLGVSRKCLYDKINKYGLDINSFRKTGG